MARKSGFVRRNNVMRRETAWLGGVVAQTAIAAPGTAVLVSSLNAAALALRPFTVVRTRGSILVVSDQSSATEDQEVGWGVAVVSDQAAAIGITAVPTPVTDSDSDLFFAYEMLFGSIRVASEIGKQQSYPGDMLIIDSKAMRKVNDSEDVVDVLETSGTSEGCTIITFFRQLVKLH